MGSFLLPPDDDLTPTESEIPTRIDITGTADVPLVAEIRARGIDRGLELCQQDCPIVRRSNWRRVLRWFATHTVEPQWVYRKGFVHGFTIAFFLTIGALVAGAAFARWL